MRLGSVALEKTPTSPQPSSQPTKTQEARG